MEGGTIVVLALAAAFLGLIVWLAIQSRWQSAKKDSAGPDENAEQLSRTEEKDRTSRRQ